MKVVTSKLLTWYAQSHRDLPWRNTENPYEIWVSEMILQQTRVEQGLPYYHRFLDKFPQINDLAMADELDVLKVWQGLGYYARARNMHQTAKIICELHQGHFPNTYEKLLQLKGIGPYTAAAIASFAFKIPVPAIDGNVKRVVARLFDLHQDISQAGFLKEATMILEDLIPSQAGDQFNQAMMELGATVCTPHQPKCNVCPLNQNCFAFSNKTVQLLPIKKSKLKVKERKLIFVEFEYFGSILIQKRDSKGIWGGLYEFPNFEVSSNLTKEFPLKECPWDLKIDLDLEFQFQKRISHKLTHQNQDALLFYCDLSDSGFYPQDWGLWIPKDELKSFPIHKLMLKFVT